jgi:UDP-GlcNAc:undecaprenyl-phosphate GlcNAc-1-phosphate transferase
VSSYLLVLGIAAVATYALTFVVRALANRFGAVVPPDERRLHARPTATAGGAAMFLAFLVAMAAATRIGHFKPMFDGSTPLGVVLAGTVVFLVGLVDDLREMSAPAKLAGQVLAGSVLSLLGVVMVFFRVPFFDLIGISPDLAPLATVLWVVAMANAVNFIDGLDGLAAGVVAIAAGAFFLYGYRLASDDVGLLAVNNPAPLLAAIVCGLCLGFLPHNFHPARIFMGDAGAMFLGLLMAASTLLVGGGTDTEFSGQTYFFYAPIFIPFFILGVPIVDTLFAIVRRAARRQGVVIADRGHLHYRLERMGHGHRRAVLILWAWTAILSGFVLYPTFTDRGNAVIPFGVAALGVALYTLFHPGVRVRQNGDARWRSSTVDA